MISNSHPQPCAIISVHGRAEGNVDLSCSFYLSRTRQIPGQWLKWQKAHFLPHHHQFTFYCSSELLTAIFSKSQINVRNISDFRHDAHEICILLGCYAASIGSLLPTFRSDLSVPSSYLEDGTNLLSRNVENTNGRCVKSRTKSNLK